MWYFVSEGKKEGPYSREEIFSKLISNEINQNFLVWTNGMSDWEILEKTDLKDLLNSIPPAIPSIKQHSPENKEKFIQNDKDKSSLFHCPKCGFENRKEDKCCSRCGVYFSKIKTSSSEEVKSRINNVFDPTKDSLYGLGGWLLLPAFLWPIVFVFFLFVLFFNNGADIWNYLVWNELPLYNSINAIYIFLSFFGGLYILVLFYAKNSKFPLHFLVLQITSIVLFHSLLIYNAINDGYEAYKVFLLKSFLSNTFALSLCCLYFVKSKRVYVTFFKKDYRKRTTTGISTLWIMSKIDEKKGTVSNHYFQKNSDSNIINNSALSSGRTVNSNEKGFEDEDFILNDSGTINNKKNSLFMVWESVNEKTKLKAYELFKIYLDGISPRDKVIFSRFANLSTIEWSDEHKMFFSFSLIYLIWKKGLSKFSFKYEIDNKINSILKEVSFHKNLEVPENVEILLFNFLENTV